MAFHASVLDGETLTLAKQICLRCHILVRSGCAVLLKRSAAALIREPAVELIRTKHNHLAEHQRMVRSTVLGAEKLVAPGLNCLEPGLGIAAREDVLLYPECRNEEGMNHVPRRH